MNTFTFKIGDIVPRWVAVDSKNEDCVLRFGCDGNLSIGVRDIIWKPNSKDEVLIDCEPCCSGAIACNNERHGTLICDYSNVGGANVFPVRAFKNTQLNFTIGKPSLTASRKEIRLR